MKKLYSLLCAVAVTALAANAAAPMVMRSADKVALTPELNTMTLTEAPANVAPVKSHKAVSKTVAKAAAEALAKADYELPTGDYLWRSAMRNGLSELSRPAQIKKGEGANEYILDIAYFSQVATGNLSATLSMETDQGYTFPVLTIKPGTKYFELQGDSFAPYLYFMSTDGKWYYSTQDDIKLIVIGDMILNYYEDAGIAFFNVSADGAYGFAYTICEFYKPNSNAAYKSISGDGNGGEVAKNVSEDIYVAVDTEELTMSLIGFDMYTINLKYDLDYEVVYSTFEAPVLKLMNSNDEEDTTIYDLYFCYLNNGQLYSVPLEIQTEGTKSYLVFDPRCGVLCNSANEAMGGWYGVYTNIEVEIPAELTAALKEAAIAGVEDIVAGEAVDADAPVEYFNLQGQRVAEPAAGLYIKRQGKTVSKVVIR